MNTQARIYVGGEDAAHSLPLPSGATASDLLDRVRAAGVSVGADAAVYVEDGDQPLAPAAALSVGDGAPTSFYVGPQHPVRVTVGYGSERVVREFSPATRLRTVERWAAKDLDAPTQKPHRLALRYADTVLTPDEDAYLGALDKNADRDLHFDLDIEEDEPFKATVVVNGRPKTVAKRRLTFAEVVALADNLPSGPQTSYHVTYRRGRGDKPEGILAEGDTVKVKDSMVFNVTATNRS